MLCGIVEFSRNGIWLKVSGHNHMLYIGYSLRESIKQYRELNNLKYRKIKWETIRG